ncbi:MAG: lycopene cyclase domain-containing protein, partial [bacterium]|nr:lycopene cyclase domain-containing protein [bacterium]
ALSAGVYAFGYWLIFRFMLMLAFPGALETAWNLEALWDVRLAGVPAEEVLWAFVLALFVGPIVRACSESPKMEHG